MISKLFNKHGESEKEMPFNAEGGDAGETQNTPRGLCVPTLRATTAPPSPPTNVARLRGVREAFGVLKMLTVLMLARLP